MDADGGRKDIKMGYFYTAVQLYFDCGTPWVILWCKFSWTVPQKNSSKTGSGTAMKKDRVTGCYYTPRLSEGSSLIPSKSDSVSKSSAGSSE